MSNESLSRRLDAQLSLFQAMMDAGMYICADDLSVYREYIDKLIGALTDGINDVDKNYIDEYVAKSASTIDTHMSFLSTVVLYRFRWTVSVCREGQ